MRNTTSLLAALALAGLGLAACGEEEETNGACDGRFADAAQVYALAPQIAGATSGEYNTYLVLTDRLEGQEVGLECSMELTGRALVNGLGDGAVFVTAGDAPTVTRYDLVDGSLKKGATVNFAARGVSSLGEYAGQFVFVSPTKAYFFDGTGAQVIVWNPKEMVVTGALSFAEFAMPETTLSLSAAPLVLGDKIVMFPGWRTSTSIPSRAGVIVVDTTTDEIHTAEDSRCGYVRDGIPGADGMIYMATEAVGSARHRINPDSAPPPCMIRYNPETGAFDPDFYVNLDQLFGGDTAGTLVRGPNDEAFLRILDESLVTIDENTNLRALASAPAWRWARITLEDEPKISRLDLPPSGGSVLLTEIDGKTYFPVMGDTHSELLEMTADGPGASVVRVQGRLFSVTRVK